MTASRLLDNWSPPDGAGGPLACLATTFTFQADFFRTDCLARFLKLSSSTDEGDRISTLAAVLEEEERLAEAQISVLVDRSSPAERRNLRWDVLPVHVRGGLLHAKAAVLIWERSARIMLGSANLTEAGYRRQVELGLTIDLDENCRVPRAVLDDLVAELRLLVDLTGGEDSVGPGARARATLGLLSERIAAIDHPVRPPRDLRMAVAPARPGTNPLDRLPEAWRGSAPLRATILSPFWDDLTPAPAISAVQMLLTGRPASGRQTTVIAVIDPYTGRVQAPVSLSNQGASLVAFIPPDDEPLRALHAKLILVENDDWVAALIGSSNATGSGLGLRASSGHHELNMWIGAPQNSPAGKHLRELARPGEPIDVDELTADPAAEDDLPTTPELQLGFLSCTIAGGPPGTVALTLDPGELPDQWWVTSPSGQEVLDADTWRAKGSPGVALADLEDGSLPAYVVVAWSEAGADFKATLTANVEDRTQLPPPAELADLPVELLLAALASTRPLPVALERELRRRETATDSHGDGADPLREFDDRGLLFRRIRHTSQAFARLQQRLSRPAMTLDALHWRLYGAIGPLALADGLVAMVDGEAGAGLAGETHFLLAELALTVAAVDWQVAAAAVDQSQAAGMVADVVQALVKHRDGLEPVDDPAMTRYVDEALREAVRCAGN